MNVRDDTKAPQRFWNKVEKTATCWNWKGTITLGGYGLFRYKGVLQGAHRVAYKLYVGEIPEGLCLDHLCRVRSCVRPSHLEPVTTKENINRGILTSSWSHGTMGGYKYRKCNCEPCVLAYRKYVRDLKKRHKTGAYVRPKRANHYKD